MIRQYKFKTGRDGFLEIYSMDNQRVLLFNGYFQKKNKFWYNFGKFIDYVKSCYLRPVKILEIGLSTITLQIGLDETLEPVSAVNVCNNTACLNRKES